MKCNNIQDEKNLQKKVKICIITKFNYAVTPYNLTNNQIIQFIKIDFNTLYLVWNSLKKFACTKLIDMQPGYIYHRQASIQITEVSIDHKYLK